MSSKKTIIVTSILLIVSITLVAFKLKTKSNESEAPKPKKRILKINTIPVSERLFATITPDSSGRYIYIRMDGKLPKNKLDYEVLYHAGDKDEGAGGHINLEQEQPPIERKMLLGSKSAGGSITYHEGITGGYMMITSDNAKLKEDFNFLRFDPKNEDGYTSTDIRFTAYFTPKQLKRNTVIIVMKSFGFPKPIPSGELESGPYFVGTPNSTTPSKIEIATSSKDVKLYEYKDGEWSVLDATYGNGMLTATPTSNLFVVLK